MATVRDPDLDRIEKEPMTRAARQEPDQAMATLKTIFYYLFYFIFFFFIFLPLLGGHLTLWPEFSRWWVILENVNPYAFGALGISLSIAYVIREDDPFDGFCTLFFTGFRSSAQHGVSSSPEAALQERPSAPPVWSAVT